MRVLFKVILYGVALGGCDSTWHVVKLQTNGTSLVSFDLQRESLSSFKNWVLYSYGLDWLDEMQSKLLFSFFLGTLSGHNHRWAQELLTSMEGILLLVLSLIPFGGDRCFSLVTYRKNIRNVLLIFYEQIYIFLRSRRVNIFLRDHFQPFLHCLELTRSSVVTKRTRSSRVKRIYGVFCQN